MLTSRISSIILILLFFVSCKKDRNISIPESTNIVDSVSPMFFINSKFALVRTNANFFATSKFEYIHNSIVKRSGSLSYFSWVGNYDNYTDKIFDTLVYDGNKISVYSLDNTQRINSYLTVTPIVYTMSNGRPLFRTFYLKLTNYDINDTLYYYYNPRGQLIRTLETYKASYIENIREYLFTYDLNGNLVFIRGTLSSYQNGNLNIYFLRRTEESFEEYDNVNNPLNNRMWLWDDLLYRSLSKNNFSKYTYKQYDYQNNHIALQIIQIPLTYDSNGNLKLNP